MKPAVLTALRSAVLTLGSAALLLGIRQGEPFVVLRRAALVCLECIGIG